MKNLDIKVFLLALQPPIVQSKIEEQAGESARWWILPKNRNKPLSSHRSIIMLRKWWLKQSKRRCRNLSADVCLFIYFYYRANPK